MVRCLWLRLFRAYSLPLESINWTLRYASSCGSVSWGPDVTLCTLMHVVPGPDGDMDIITSSYTQDALHLHVNNGQKPTPGFSTQLIATINGIRFGRGADLVGPCCLSTLSFQPKRAGSVCVIYGVAHCFPRRRQNDDGFADIISCSNLDDTIFIHISNGLPSPGFSKQLIYTGVNGAQSVFAADINNDTFIGASVLLWFAFVSFPPRFPLSLCIPPPRLRSMR